MDQTGEQNRTVRNSARVYLLVDNKMIRAGLECLLTRGRFNVVGHDSDPAAALEALRQGIADIALVDLRHPQSDGFHWAVKLREELPEVRILVIRENPAVEQVNLALQSGVDCVLASNGEMPELFIALDSLHRGYTYLSPRLHPTVAASGAELPEAFTERSVILSEREIEIVCLLALGRTTAEIAESCEIEEDDAGELVLGVGRKLECHSAADFARLAIREGYLPR